jgi:hypothetical protein
MMKNVDSICRYPGSGKVQGCQGLATEKLSRVGVPFNIAARRIYIWLVVWNMTFIFPYIGNLIIPTHEPIFFRGVGKPPTRYGLSIGYEPLATSIGPFFYQV